MLTYLAHLLPSWAMYSLLLSFLLSVSADVATFKEVSREKTGSYETAILNVRSVQWLNHPEWKHPVRIFIPENVETENVLVFLKGGDTNAPLPEVSPQLIEGALKTKAIVAEVFAIPNQPCAFEGTEEKREDALVAYSWKCFLDKGEEGYPLHQKMAEAVQVVLTALQDYLKGKAKGFVLTGESKRGWISYLAAANDSRVKAIIPVVADFLNIKENFTHHFNSLNSWSPAIQDYLDLGLDSRMFNHERYNALVQKEDPYSFRHQLTLPKYIILASGDPFSMPDTTKTYLQGLVGPTYLRLIPNCGHKINMAEYYPSLFTFFKMVSSNQQLPALKWEVKDGNLMASSAVRPESIKLWSSANPKQRDFRFDFTGCRFEETNLSFPAKVSLEAPNEGWKTVFIEANFSTSAGPFVVTTEAFVLPNRYPEATACQ